jgi:peptide/nickel transport system substrate-binding protein
MGDEEDQTAAVERGRLDVAPVFASATGPRLRALRTRIGTRLRSGAFAMTEYAWLNTQAPPFDDLRVRRALNLAVERGRIVSQTGGRDAGAPTCQLLPSGLPGYRPICPFTLAPSPAGTWTRPRRAEARRLVAASGADGVPVEVWTWPARKQAARQLAAALDDLGLDSRVRVFRDLGTSLEAAADPKEHPQIGLNGWIADVPDPGTFLRSLIGCGATFNLSRFCDRRMEAAIDRAQAGGADARAEWERIESRIAHSAPVVPLTTRRSVAATSRRAGNVQFHPILGVLLDQVWVR